MFLVILTAFTAVCGAAKLDQNYLPPITAKTAGGSAGILQAPFEGLNKDSLPTGGYTNDAQGVVVDAVNPGTRASGLEPTGLGGPRASYGSTDSKVGDAAFIGSEVSPLSRIAPGFDSFVDADESVAAKTGNKLKFTTDVGLENYSYEFETDNGISAVENGVAANGVQAQGGYSYKGDDGKTYSVTYTADENGYKPQGHHLPTPPPIPEEIVKSLETNAKEEAAGLVDDGSYDAQKYNDDGDYSSNGAHNSKYTIGGGDATTSGSYVSQIGEGYRPTSGVLVGSYNPSSIASQSLLDHGAHGQVSGNKQATFGFNKASGDSSSIGGQFGQAGTSTQGGYFGNVGQFGASSQNNQGAQGTDFSQSTENRFGVQTTKSDINDIASPSVNSAYSSAFTTGSGSASAFASTGSSGFGLKNEYVSPFNKFGSAGQYSHGYGSTAGTSYSSPSSATASASVSGKPTAFPQFSYTSSPSLSGVHSNKASGVAISDNNYGSPLVSQSSQSSGASFGSESESTGKVSYGSNIQGSNFPSTHGHNNGQLANVPSSASASASVSDNQLTFSQSNEQFNGIKTQSNSNGFPNTFGQNLQSGNTAEYLPPVQIIESTGKPTYNSKPQGFDSSSAASQSTFIGNGPSTARPSSFGVLPQSQTNNVIQSSSSQTQFGSTNSQFSNVQPTQHTIGSISSQGPTKVPDTELTTPFESNGIVQPLGSTKNPVSSPTPGSAFSSFQQSSQSGSTFQSQSKPFTVPSAIPTQQFTNNRQPNSPVSSVSQQGSKFSNTPTTLNVGQYQGSSSYSGITQAAVSSFPASSSSSFSQSTPQSSQYGTKPTTSAQFGQLGSSQQTSTQFGSTGTQQTFSEQPVTQFGQKPIVQSQTSDSSELQTQQYQGTIYQYNKPAVSLPAPEHKDSSSSFEQVTSSHTDSVAKPSQVQTDSRFSSQQGSSQFSSQSFGSSETVQNTAYGSQTSKPLVNQGAFSTSIVSQGQSEQTPQFNLKPFVSSQTTGSNYQQSQFGGSASQLSQKPQTTQASSLSSNSNTYAQSQTTQYGNKPTSIFQTGLTLPQTQFGSTSSQFGQNSQKTQVTGLTSTTSQTTFNQKPSGSYQQSQFGLNSSQFGQKPQTIQGSTISSNTYSQNQSQFGKKPTSTFQTGSTFSQGQFGSSGSQFGQNSQITKGTGVTSTTTQSTLVQKPAGSYQQSQFGLSSSPFGQKPQTTQSSTFSTNTYSQSQTSQFGKKPTSTFLTGSKFPQAQFGSAGSQFGQNSQLTQGTGVTSTTTQTTLVQKPSSFYQQSQFGANSQFGQKPQSTQASSFTSTTNTFGQSQTSQFGKKPTSTIQTGSTFPQTSFGLTGSKFGQNSQTVQGTGLTSTNSQTTFGQKPSGFTQTGSTYQTQIGSTGTGQNYQTIQGSGVSSLATQSTVGQKPSGFIKPTQFGLTSSQFSQKPQSTQTSSFSSTSNTFTQSQTSQFGKKPIGTSQTGSSFQQATFGQKPSGFTQTGSTYQTQIGSIGSQFGQNSQSTKDTGVASTTTQTTFGQKPSGSYQSTQFGSTGSLFGQKPQTSQGSTFSSNTYSQSQTSQFGKKPVSTFQTGSTFPQAQFGSASSQFGQNSQSTQAVISTTTQTNLVQKPVVSFQQSQFGSQFSQKPATTQGSSFSSNTYSQSQTSQFGKKPTGTSQTGSTLAPTQAASVGSQLGQNTQTIQGTGLSSTTGQTTFSQKPAGSYQQSQFGLSSSQFGQKPQTTQGSSFSSNTYSQSQTFQYGTKPTSISQTGSTFPKVQFGSSGSQFGQNSLSTQGTGVTSTTTQTTLIQKPVGSFQQSQFGLSSSQFGQKPQTNQGSSFSSNTYSQSQTSQFGKKPIGTSQTGSIFTQTQLGSVGSQLGQNTQKIQGTGLTSTTGETTISQKPAGSYQQSQFGLSSSQFGQKPQTSQGSSFSSNTYSQSQTFQYGTKPTSTSQTGSTFPKVQFGSSGSQFGQNSLSTQGTGVTSTTTQTTLIQKPVGSFQQSQFGLSSSQFGQKPQTNQGSSFSSNTYSQSQTSQFGNKPIGTSQTGSIFTQTQLGSVGSQLGQNTQKIQGTGLTSTTGETTISQKPAGSYQQSQFGLSSAQFGQKPQTSQGSSFSSNTYSQSQTFQYGTKPTSTSQTGSTFPKVQFGSSGSQFGQNSLSTQGTGVTSTTTQTTLIQKPVGSFQQSQFGSSSSQFGKKPTSSTQTGLTSPQTQFGTFGSQFGQNSQTLQGSGLTSATGQALYSQKPSVTTQTSSFYQQTKYGSTNSRFGEKPSTSVTTNTVSKGQSEQSSPLGGITSQNAGSDITGSGTGSQYEIKPQSSQGLVAGISSQGSAILSASGFTNQQSQFASSTGSQFGSVDQGSISQVQPVKPFGSSQTSQESTNSQTQFGSTGSGFGQTSESSEAKLPTLSTVSQSVQPVQFGEKPVVTSENTASSIQTTQFGTVGSGFDQKPVTIQTAQTPSSTFSSYSQNSQFGTQTKKPYSNSQTPTVGQFASSTGQFGQKPQVQAIAFASSSGTQFGQTDQVSKYQQISQTGTQTQGASSAGFQPQKPLGSSLSQANYQQFQYTQTGNKFGSQSQFGQTSQSNVGNGQAGQTLFGSQTQKPFGSQTIQSTYQQTQYNQDKKPFGVQGSSFQIGQSLGDQKTQSSQSNIQTTSVSSQSSQGSLSSAQSAAGYNYPKPQTLFNSASQLGQINGAQGQKFQQTQSNYYAPISTVQTPIVQTIKPFGSSSTQNTFQESQSSVGSTQFGVQPTKTTDYSFSQFGSSQPVPSKQGSSFQTSSVSTSQFGLQPIKPASVNFGQSINPASTQGTYSGSQSLVGSTSQFGSQSVSSTTQNPSQNQYSVEPFKNVFSSTPTTGFQLGYGSNFNANLGGSTVSTVETSIVPVPGYEIDTSSQGGLVGLAEEFGGPRDPPRFDDKTGYYY